MSDGTDDCDVGDMMLFILKRVSLLIAFSLVFSSSIDLLTFFLELGVVFGGSSGCCCCCCCFCAAFCVVVFASLLKSDLVAIEID